MDADQIAAIFDAEYAAIYDQAFLLGRNYFECTRHDLGILRSLLRSDDSRWLDVGCGTGFFLRQIPNCKRAGLDISPAMLEYAKKQNPDIAFRLGDFRDQHRDWREQWDLVSCMWYAYSYAGSLSGVDRMMRNMCSWIAPGGTCFVPIVDPDILCKVHIPYVPPTDSDDGALTIPAVLWTWTDFHPRRTHAGLVAVKTEYLADIFKEHFSEVEIEEYPEFNSDSVSSRVALIARNKR